MPRSFPFPISVGTDICSKPRIRRLLFKQSSKRLFQKVLSPKEFEIHWPRFQNILHRMNRENRFHTALSENFNPRHLAAKRKQLGLQSLWPSRDSVAIKEGTDAEPMRVGDVHILRMLIILEENIRITLNSSAADINTCTSFLAGRWAAKEAIIKAHHSRRLTFHDIEIQQGRSLSESSSSPPVAVIISESGDWDDGQIVPISISHDGDYAIATCMAYEPSPGAVFETADDVHTALGGMNADTSTRSEEITHSGSNSATQQRNRRQKETRREGPPQQPYYKNIFRPREILDEKYVPSSKSHPEPDRGMNADTSTRFEENTHSGSNSATRQMRQKDNRREWARRKWAISTYYRSMLPPQKSLDEKYMHSSTHPEPDPGSHLRDALESFGAPSKLFDILKSSGFIPKSPGAASPLAEQNFVPYRGCKRVFPIRDTRNMSWPPKEPQG